MKKLPIVFTALTLTALTFTTLTFISRAHHRTLTDSVFSDDANAVVQVVSDDPANDDGFSVAGLQKFSSGFVLNKNGCVVTTPDVVSGHKVILVIETVNSPAGARHYVHRATVKSISLVNNVAILQCSDMHATPIALAKESVKFGDPVVALGYTGTRMLAGSSRMPSFFEALAAAINPTWKTQTSWDITDLANNPAWYDGFGIRETEGFVHDPDIHPFDGSGETSPLILSSIDMEPGASGGVLLDENGNLAGMLDRSQSEDPDDHSDSLAVGIDRVLQQAEKGGVAAR